MSNLLEIDHFGGVVKNEPEIDINQNDTNSRIVENYMDEKVVLKKPKSVKVEEEKPKEQKVV